MDSIPKFIIDTDPGIDDCMAIFMAIEAHRKGLIEIVAFTLVAGNTELENIEVNMMRIMKLAPELIGKVSLKFLNFKRKNKFPILNLGARFSRLP